MCEKSMDLKEVVVKLDEETDNYLRFQDLSWRLEMITDSRAIKNINKPRIVMQFKFREPNGNKLFKHLVSDAPNLFNFRNNIEDALLENNSNQMLKIIQNIK